mgnify:CR=1 FL=1
MKTKSFFLRMCQGALIGLGAVLPGISGGVLSVIFGVYKPVMELLANPVRNFKTHVPKLFPIILGGIIGYVLEKYPNPSVCLFVGLIGGMLPSLFREAGQKGRSKGSYISLVTAMLLVFALLIGLQSASVTISPSFGWFVFCGFCLALSIIAPGMSFSTLLMPLGLYTPFVDGLGHLSVSVALPGLLGAAITMLILPKFVNRLFEKHYSVAFHAIVGVVIAATVMTVPWSGFTGSVREGMINLFFLAAGVFLAQLLDAFNSKVEVPEKV